MNIQIKNHGTVAKQPPEDIDQIRNEIVSDVIDKILAREIANNPSLAVNRDDLKAKLVETLLVNLRR